MREIAVVRSHVKALVKLSYYARRDLDLTSQDPGIRPTNRDWLSFNERWIISIWPLLRKSNRYFYLVTRIFITRLGVKRNIYTEWLVQPKKDPFLLLIEKRKIYWLWHVFFLQMYNMHFAHYFFLFMNTYFSFHMSNSFIILY